MSAEGMGPGLKERETFILESRGGKRKEKMKGRQGGRAKTQLIKPRRASYCVFKCVCIFKFLL